MAQCVRSVFPDVPVIPFILPAGTDARTLTELCPCVLRFAPIRLSAQQLASVHSENENIDITAIGTAVIFYRRVLERYSPLNLREDPEDDELDELEELEEPEQEEEAALPEEPEEDYGLELDLSELEALPEEPEELPEGEDFSMYIEDDLSDYSLDMLDDVLLTDWEDNT